MAAIQNFVGQWTRPADPPAGFAKTHGRIEATRVMITTKLAGKIQEVLVREGDTVDAGQVVARMDTRSLKAQFQIIGVSSFFGKKRMTPIILLRGWRRLCDGPHEPKSGRRPRGRQGHLGRIPGTWFAGPSSAGAG